MSTERDAAQAKVTKVLEAYEEWGHELGMNELSDALEALKETKP